MNLKATANAFLLIALIATSECSLGRNRGTSYNVGVRVDAPEHAPAREHEGAISFHLISDQDGKDGGSAADHGSLEVEGDINNDNNNNNNNNNNGNGDAGATAGDSGSGESKANGNGNDNNNNKRYTGTNDNDSRGTGDSNGGGNPRDVEGGLPRTGDVAAPSTVQNSQIEGQGKGGIVAPASEIATGVNPHPAVLATGQLVAPAATLPLVLPAGPSAKSPLSSAEASRASGPPAGPEPLGANANHALTAAVAPKDSLSASAAAAPTCGGGEAGAQDWESLVQTLLHFVSGSGSDPASPNGSGGAVPSGAPDMSRAWQ